MTTVFVVLSTDYCSVREMGYLSSVLLAPQPQLLSPPLPVLQHEGDFLKMLPVCVSGGVCGQETCQKMSTPLIFVVSRGSPLPPAFLSVCQAPSLADLLADRPEPWPRVGLPRASLVCGFLTSCRKGFTTLVQVTMQVCFLKLGTLKQGRA